MALSDEEKQFLDRLKRDLSQRVGPNTQRLKDETEVIDLTGISIDDLRALTDTQVTIGVDFNSIDTSKSFTSRDMNRIAPGAIDVPKLISKLSAQSFLKARVVDILDTQSGTLAVNNELRVGADIEDLMTDKVKSQGINLQLVQRGRDTNPQEVADKDVFSRFIGG